MKRKQISDSSDSRAGGDNQVKKVKSVKRFTEIDFKVMLKNQNTTFTALENFIKEAVASEKDVDSDIVLRFCKTSPDCKEILCLLDVPRRKPTELYLVMRALELVLLRATSHTQLTSTARTVTRLMHTTHLGRIYLQLAMRNKSLHIKGALQLLIAMTIHAPKDVYARFDFTHHTIPALLNRRDIKDADDVRSCLIHFLLAFFIHGDSAITVSLVNTKGLLNSIFAGLEADKLSTIEFVLKTLQEHVVRNAVVNKSSKIRVFNEKALRQISRLYHWSGSCRRQHKSSGHSSQQPIIEDEAELSDDQKTVRFLVHEFLLQLCCSFKNGINFFDRSFGTSAKPMNNILSGLLSSLRHADRLQAELTVAVLRTCPDLLHSYLPSIQNSLAPRLSASWLNSCNFFVQIYNAQPDVCGVWKLQEKHDIDKLVAMATKTSIPPRDIWAQVISAIKHKSSLVRHKGLQMLLLVLTKAQTGIAYCQQQDQSSSMEQKWLKCVLAFRDTLAKMLPSVDHVYNCWTQSDDISSDKTDTTDKADSTPAGDLQAPDELDRLTTVLRVLCAYNDVLASVSLPAAHLVSMLERIQVVSSVQSAAADDQQLLVELQLQMMRLLSTSDGRQIAWTKQSSQGQSVTYLLLEMVLTTVKNTDLNKSIKQLLVKLLASTGMFERCESEIVVWLDCLSSVDATTQPNAVEAILCFVEKSFAKALHNPYEYAEQIRHLVSEAVTERGDTAAAACDIDALLAMDDTVLECEHSAEDGDGDVRGERLPFSILLIISVEGLATTDNVDAAVSQFIHEMLLRVLWLQDDPLPLCLLIKHHLASLSDNTCELANRLRSSFSRWLPQLKGKGPSALSNQVDIVQDGDIAQCLQKCFENAQTSVFKEHLLCRFREEHPSEEASLNLIRQILLYLSSEMGTFQVRAEISLSEVQAYFDLLQVFIDSDDVSTDVFDLVLQCRSLHRHFLSCDSELSRLVTERVCAIASSIPTSLRLSAALRPYSERIEAQLMAGDLSHDVLNSFLPYMDVKAVGRWCEWLAQQSLEALVCGTSLTAHGLAFVSIAAHLSDCPTTSKLSHATVTRLLAMAPIAQNARLDTLLLSALRAEPNLTDCVTAESFLSLLDTGNESQLRIVALCATASSICWQRFASWCVNHVEQVKRDWTRYTHVILHWMAAGWQAGDVTNAEQNRQLAWLSDFYYSKLSQSTPQEQEQTVPGEEEKDDRLPTDDHYRLLCVLAKMRLNNDNATEMLQQASVQLQSERPSLSQFKYYCYLLDCLRQGAVYDCLREQFVIDCMHALLALLQNRTQTYFATEKYVIKSGLKTIQSLEELSETFVKSVSPIWEKFMKMGLRYHYQTSVFHDWLRLTASAIYHVNPDVAHIGDLHEMLTSHSKFLPTMLQHGSKDLPGHTTDTHSSNAPDTFSKGAVLKLLLTLLRLQPSHCNKAHLPIFFASYGATLHETDQVILCLLRHHEANGNSLKEYRPYVWGSRALEQYALKKDLGPSLLKQPTMQEVVELLKPDVLHKSSVLFPLKRRLHDVDQYRSIPVDQLMSSEICYDPCFLLPLFAHLLAPANLVSCDKFVEVGCLGYLMSSLSSEDSNVRGAACHCLYLFSQHLDSAHNYTHYEQVAYLLECVQNSFEKAGAKLASIISVFLVRACQLISIPDDPLYQAVNAFLLLKPNLDLHNIPEFYKLFNSATLQLKVERLWMLSLLAEGLRRHEDYHIFEKRYAFKLLLGFHDSSFSDSQTRKQVLCVLSKACKIRSVCRDLINNHALLAWISAAAINSSSADEMHILAEILLSIWDILVMTDGQQALQGRCGNENATKLMADDVILIIFVLLRNSRSWSDKRLSSPCNGSHIKVKSSVETMLLDDREKTQRSTICEYSASLRADVENTLFHRVNSYISTKGNETSTVQHLFVQEL